KAEFQLVASGRALAGNFCKGLADSLSIPSFPPPVSDLTALARKYAPDLLTQATYIGGAVALKNDWGGITTRVQNAVPTHRRLAVPGLDQTEILQWWVLAMGIVTGLVLVIKNIWIVATQIMEVIDKMEDAVNKAIDTKQAEISDDVQEMLEESMAKPTAMMVKIPLVRSLSTQIDDAQKELDLNTMLPCPLSSRFNFMSVFGTAGVTVVLAMGAY
ncbi:unnamed protein product, partial [Polarella glacialis]